MSTNSQIAFSPLGQTIVVAAAAVAPAGIQAPVNGKQDARVQAICVATHTAAVVAAYKAAVAKP